MATVLARSARATLPPARRSATMPEPTTVATRNTVPRNSAVILLWREEVNIVLNRLMRYRESQDHEGYCNFAYSALACFGMGMSGSASFQRVRKSL